MTQPVAPMGKNRIGMDNTSRGAGMASTNQQFEKELASQRSAGIAGGCIGTAEDKPRDSTATEIFIRELEQTCSVLSEALERQEQFKARMFGPSPVDPNAKNNAPTVQGAFGLVEERLMWLRGLSQRIMHNAIELNRIG